MIIELGDDEKNAADARPASANGERAPANGKPPKKAPKAEKAEKAEKSAKAEKKAAKKKADEPAEDEAKAAEKAAQKAAEKAKKAAKKAEKEAKKAAKAEKKAKKEAQKRAEKEARKAAEDEESNGKKKRKLTFESFLGREEAVAYFEQVLAGLSEGSVELRQGEDGVSLSPGAEVEFELTASQNGKKEKLAIEFSWRAEKGDADLSIES